ncbi:MAG: sulfite exporter TauE/SafE family protein [Mariprofundaceae bacterium]|nr:sulfite exporter TauE/SafE family protein [Mariprofundaceae bacterium]
MDAVSYELIICGLFVGLAGGAIGGTLAGVAGIGGGLIYMPLLYLAMPGNQDGLSLHVMASLAAVAVTGFFSARAHWRLGHLNRNAFRKLVPGLIVGAAIGLWSTLKIPEAVILFTLALLDAWIAWDYGRRQTEKRAVPLASLSAPVGYISGVLGIGGGTMLVPLLRRQVSLREAIGTSAACGMVMAFSAVLFNLLFESAWVGLLSGQLFFLTGALAGILLIIPKTSGWSARLHAALPEPTMQRMLKGLFTLLSAALFLAAMLAL